MDLSNLRPAKGSNKKGKRLGRGQGSGKGGTSTRGHKGAKSRSGYSRKVGFEGGQMPLSRRLPKLRGFGRSYLKIKEGVFTVTTSDLNKLANDSTVDLKVLVENKILSTKANGAKIVLKGELTKKLNLVGLKASKNAKEMIEKLGGSIK